jgi:hypothetical protein
MFCPIAGFPKYIISNEGVIYSQRGEMKPTLREGYKRIGLTNGIRKTFSIHCLVYQHFGKDWNPELTVDHINGDRADNRIENLRMATQQEQNFNTKIYTNNKLGIKGVHFRNGKYRARTRFNNKLINIGTFDTLEEASEAYKTKARELHGEFFRE